MKELLNTLDKFAKVANGQEITIHLNEQPLELLKECAKKFDVEMRKPESAMPYFRVWFDYKSLSVLLHGRRMKQVSEPKFL
jgi:hypothetical protein